jgi:hypothetical protein
VNVRRSSKTCSVAFDTREASERGRRPAEAAYFQAARRAPELALVLLDNLGANELASQSPR